MTTETAPRFEILPLGKLHEAKLNPRKTFDAAALAELAGSIRKAGILQPLTVRPNDTGYEIGAGHRRYRAAKLAGLAEVPCFVKPLDDVAFLELLVFENDHREDVHPLEEAEGYRSLMLHAKYTVEQIAERLGRSVKYVYDRVKLLQLTKEAQALFREGQITAGHAILLARLKPSDQVRAIGDVGRNGQPGGLFQVEHTLWNPDESATRGTGNATRDDLKAVSVRELTAWIDTNVKFDKTAVDPMLFPETASRVTAARESAEKVVQITHEHYVPPEARDPKERIYFPRSWKSAAIGKGKTAGWCDYAVTGVIVVGPGRGDALKVCVNKDRCDAHWGKERKTKRSAAGSRSEAATCERVEAQAKARQTQAEARRARWTKALPTVCEALATAVKKASTAATGPLAKLILELLDGRGASSHHRLPLGRTADDLVRHVAYTILAVDAEEEGDEEWSQFPKRVKALGVDVKKILHQVTPVETSAQKPTGKKKGRAA